MALSKLNLRPRLLSLLSDRRLHDRAELVEAIRPLVPAEDAKRRCLRHWPKDKSIDPDVIYEQGLSEILRDVLYRLKRAGLVVTVGPNSDRLYRLA